MQPADFGQLSPGRLVPTIQGAKAFLPASAPRELPLEISIVRLLAQAERGLGELSGAARRLPNAYLVGAPLLRREAILSSRIEETIATPETLALFELGAGPRTDDAREVGNFLKAMQYALDAVGAGDPITSRLILETHAVLMTGVRGERERPGEFRDSQNHIGRSRDIHEARFVPPPPGELPVLLSDLERLMNEDAKGLPTLIRVALAHYQFEVIHPFRDGNGRIGRLLVLLMLVREKLLSGPLLPISSAFERHRTAYADCLLGVSVTGDWSAWLRFFLESVVESANEAIALVGALDDLRGDLHRKFQSARSSALLLKLVDSLFALPAITIATATKELGVSPASASALIRKLEEAGVLREITGRTRDRIYVARPILQVVSEHELGASIGVVAKAPAPEAPKSTG